MQFNCFYVQPIEVTESSAGGVGISGILIVTFIRVGILYLDGLLMGQTRQQVR